MLRNWLVMLLMVLMPLQLVWAASSSHCLHDTSPAQTSERTDQHSALSDLADTDCHGCHTNCCQVLLVVAAPTSILTKPSAGPFSVYALRFNSIGQDRPERPNW